MRGLQIRALLPIELGKETIREEQRARRLDDLRGEIRG